MMVNTTGAEHTRLRKLVSRSFTPRMVENLKPVIARLVNELLDPIAEAGGGNILEAVGFPLPVTIIGELLGVPELDRAQFREIVRDQVATIEMEPTAEQMALADAAQKISSDYFRALIAEKRRRPDDALLSRLVHAEADGDRLTDDELVAMASLLFNAGFETTTNLFGNGLLGLLRQPEQLALLRTNPSLFANLPDELLRFDGTAQLANRVAEAEVEIGGARIPAGEQVFALLGAGNHDPARYSDPDRLDVTRTQIQPLSFGGGVHFCLGAALARAEIGITFQTLVQRLDQIELAGDPPRFNDRLTLRGLAALHVSCKAASIGTSVAPRVALEAGSGSTAVETEARGLRPRAGDTDLRFRSELRRRIESEPERRDSMPLQTGTGLAATVALLRRNRLFERCTQPELAQLAATAYPISFDPGDLLCAEGDDSPECYVIEVGRAVVTIGRKGVRTVGEDAVVGERGVLLDAARSATVTATTHMITYAISRERLGALVAGNPSARAWMLEEIERRYASDARG